MMRLFLLRHAEAEDHAVSGDEARCLTERGQDQARTVGRFCERTGIEPQLILHSPFVRTRETARAVSEAWPAGSITLQSEPFAASGMEPELALKELRAYERFDQVMLVGHQPDISLLAASLLGLRNPENVTVDKACLIGIVVHSLAPRGGTLVFHVPQTLMR